jgi:fatty-acyl-CoA synthase
MAPNTSRGKAGLSHVWGRKDVPLVKSTIGEAFDTACDRWADRIAVRDHQQGLCRTYRDLKDEVDRLAAGLLSLELEPGDRLGLWARNSAQWITTQLAAAKAGLIFCGFNPAYCAAELEHAINKTGCAALILAPHSGRDDLLDILRSIAPEFDTAAQGRLQTATLPRLRHIILLGKCAKPGTTDLAYLIHRGGEAGTAVLQRTAARLHPDDAIVIQMTSGTTGAAKGVTLSHAKILNNSYLTGETLCLVESDRLCLPAPLYHSFGMGVGVLSALTHGAAIVLPAEAFNALQTLEAIAEERCTTVLGTPTMFLAMMDHPAFGRFDLSSLRTGIMSCSPCPAAILRRAIDQMNLREITTAYGMTETSPISFQSVPHDTLEHRVETSGRVHPHIEAKVVDSIGRTVPIGAEGELLIRGYSVMLGYWEDSVRTRAAIDSEGWLHTGDLVVLDEDGYCHIVGRLKDTIIRGGENLSPREIEDMLYRHPKIREVQVFGVPDVRYGEEICAWVRLRDGETATAKELRDFCRGQIARFKVPRYIAIVDSFPTTANGKFQKFIMRERTMDSLGLRRD